MLDRDQTLARLPPGLLPLTDKVSTRRIGVALGLADRRLKGTAVVAEAVHRRHNVSAILRTSEAFGVHEAHLIARKFKPSVGAAKGAERWMNIQMHDETGDCLSALKQRGFAIWVADFTEGALAPWDVPVDEPIALLFGAELAGVSEQAQAAADGVVYVPMRGVTQSLNVSAAAAVIMSHVCERRRQVPGVVGMEAGARAAFLERFLLRERHRLKAGKVLYESGVR